MMIRRLSHLILVMAITSTLARTAEAQLITGEDGLIDKLNQFLPLDPSQPVTVSGLCHRLDCLTSELRKDGLIVVKQPDVFSQARMTRFRNDFETQLSTDLANFHLVLSARINRLDAATTTQTTALGAALSAPGSTNVTAPAASASAVLGTTNNLFSGGTSLFGSQIAPNQGTFGSLGLASNNFGPVTSGTASAALGLGVDPTVYLDEKKRFLDHLNEIRRINLGPDQNDSSGYGLYLVRLPVSITPGECTLQGHGAELSVSAEHEFTPDFLPSAFKNLVINDIVDQIGPFIYEVIRSGFYEKYLKPRQEARDELKSLDRQNKRLHGRLATIFDLKFQKLPPDDPESPDTGKQSEQLLSRTLSEFIHGRSRLETGNPEMDRPNWNTIADRLQTLVDTRATIQPADQARAREFPQYLSGFRENISKVRAGAGVSPLVQSMANDDVEEVVKKRRKVASTGPVLDANGAIDWRKLDISFSHFILGLYKSALPDDVRVLDRLMGLDVHDRNAVSSPLSVNNARQYQLKYLQIAPLDREIGRTYSKFNKVALPSVRTAKQFYPIAPRELKDFFLEENLDLLAKDAQEASRTKTIRNNEVRTYLRHTLETAYNAMSYPTQRAIGVVPPLADQDFMNDLLEAIHERDYTPAPKGDTPSKLQALYERLIQVLSASRSNIRDEPIAALCWAIAIDAAMLDASFKYDAHKVFQAKGLPCPPLEGVHFYLPARIPNEVGQAVFCEYVKNRWPIITFSLDPVTDQQNIADSFNLKRDLQLALSFAFATGQINFSQLSTFRRQIEQSSDTIALNRTVTAFAHGADIFGFRFTPRFQNPPNQRTNIGVIASQLISGGPGPNYQTRKSKLESGMRELTAVLLLPTFLPTMRMNVSTNWFKLTDPERLIFHTGRMMEQGRRVQELRQGVVEACNSQRYREDDVRVLKSKLAQLEAMLPMQSKVIQLPFENSASGYDLFSDGATALVPELTGYSGVDVIKAPPPATVATHQAPPPPTATAPPSGTAPPPGPPAPGLTVTSTVTTPAGVQSVSVVGGSGSIADVFVFGKYISLLDTKVIAGGRSAAFEILSREVVHVQIPANVIPTTIQNVEGDATYVEIYISTPSGISNSILVPFDPGTPPKPRGYDVAFGSNSVDIFYQWLTGADQKTNLVASALPSAKHVAINWDSDTGLGPKQIQIAFIGTVNGQNLILYLPATPSNRGDYTVDAQVLAVTLLKRLQDITAAGTALPASIDFTLKVQPWLPASAEGLRVRTEPKELKSKVKVNLHYNATGQNALPAVTPANYPASAPPATPPPDAATTGQFTPAPGAAGLTLNTARNASDPAVVRTAQQFPGLPSFLTAPQQPPALAMPPLLAPNVTSEAEQAARMLTGQPLPPNVPFPSSLSSVPGAINQTVSGLATAISSPSTTGQAPTILVNPSPVIVVAHPPESTKKQQKPKSRFHKMMNSIGNRLSEAMPSR